MRSTQIRVLSGVAIAALFALTGCSSTSGSEAAPTGDAACTDGPITVGIIPKLGDDPYMTTVRDGAEAAAEAIGDGDKVVYTSPSEATGSAQIPFVQQLISQNVDVIAISEATSKAPRPN